MNVLEVVSDGFADIRAHGGRTALQTLGVVLGVASVVATMGLTAGGKAQSMQYYTRRADLGAWPVRLPLGRVPG